MPATQKIAFVKRKTQVATKVFKSPLPLVNPETLFSRGVWVETVNFIADYLQTALKVKELKKDLVVTFQDLYFAKCYDGFDFKAAEKHFSAIGFKPEGVTAEHNDRNDEFGLRLPIEGSRFLLKEFRGDICFSAGQCVGLDDSSVKRGVFQNPPVVWKTDIEGFVNFVDAVQQSLTGRGEPQNCRVYMTIELQRTRIDVACHYHPICRESEMEIWKLRHRRKVMPSNFTISFF